MRLSDVMLWTCLSQRVEQRSGLAWPGLLWSSLMPEAAL